jgi:alpha-D-ribose 1-methylphosphonate 5-triphosphate diphosphatase
VLPLARACDLISGAPAKAAGPSDRGSLTEGQRADMLLVDAAMPRRPRIAVVIAAGRLVRLTDADRIAACGPRVEAIAAE